MKNWIRLFIVLLVFGIFILSACGGAKKSEKISGNSDSISDSENSEDVKGVLTLNLDDKGILREGNDGDSFADLSVRAGPPLFKRQALYVSGCSTFRRDTPELLTLRSRTARFSLPITGKGDEASVIEYMKSTMYDLSGFGSILRKYTTPLWHVAYVSAAITEEAKQNDINPEFSEPNYDIFNAAWTAAAKYMANKNMRSLYEIWNEPDMVGFMTNFDWDGYIRLYLNAAGAIRAGDPEAVVGGPAMADMGTLGYDNYVRFIKTVNDAGAALDFVSAHYYANSKTHTLPQLLDDLRGGLGEGNKSASIIFTEFNVYTPKMSEWFIDMSERTDFRLQTTAILPEALDAIKLFNSYTDVTQIQWATLSTDNGAFGIIDPKGNKTPLYHVLNLYAHMPVESVKNVIAEKTSVSAMASADETHAGILLWNTDNKKAQKLSYQIKNIPYETYDVSVYRIDSKHSSFYETGGGDDLELLTRLEGAASSSIVWEGVIPVNGVVYLSIETGNESKLERHSRIGTVVRTDHYYKNRTDHSYADFDELTSTARIGTGDSPDSRGLTYITYSDISDKLLLELELVNFDHADISRCGMRIDYHTSEGYIYSVAYEVGNSKSGGEIPFGTYRDADAVIEISADSKTEINIKENAPIGWDGKVILSFDIEGTGKWTEAVFTLTENK